LIFSTAPTNPTGIYHFKPDVLVGHVKSSFHKGLGHLHVNMDSFSGSLQLLDALLPNIDQQELHLHGPPQLAIGGSHIIDCMFIPIASATSIFKNFPSSLFTFS